jgi:FtsP/CotA-like multicopper oxidase with cupredoxin domain
MSSQSARAQRRDYSRRTFLRLGWKLGAGRARPLGMHGCGQGSVVAASSGETFVEPPMLESVDGMLDVMFRFAYLPTMLNGKAVMVRAINERIPGPTLRVRVGDTLRINVVNRLPPNPASSEPVRHLRYPNSTNLHTHGLHVSPGQVAPGVYGDFVVDDPRLGIVPGQSRQHEYRIRRDHPAGAYWYHPHLHGATSIQVGSGMAGALIIKGEIDQVPEIAAAAERVFVFQSPITNAAGALESFTQVADNPASEVPFLINGVRRPRLVMRRGEVQNWHLINAAIFNFVNLSLDGHVLNVYGHDGNPRRDMLRIAPGGENGVVLAPGNRASVLVQAGAPGTHLLRTLRFQMGSRLAVLDEDVLAEIVVVDPPRPMSLPAEPLPVPSTLAPVTDEELAANGGMKRTIVMRTVFNDPGEPITNAPASSVVHPGSELADWVFQTGNTTLANKVFALGSASGLAFPAPGLPDEYVPFQSARALRQTVPLGSVEEWTILNMNPIRHPFHIHVNPVQIVKVNGEPIDPYWADTFGLPPNGTPADPTSVTFRTRFLDFTGATLMHCHMLAHEDMGMMQIVDIV